MDGLYKAPMRSIPVGIVIRRCIANSCVSFAFYCSLNFDESHSLMAIGFSALALQTLSWMFEKLATSFSSYEFLYIYTEATECIRFANIVRTSTVWLAMVDSCRRVGEMPSERCRLRDANCVRRQLKVSRNMCA